MGLFNGVKEQLKWGNLKYLGGYPNKTKSIICGLYKENCRIEIHGGAIWQLQFSILKEDILKLEIHDKNIIMKIKYETTEIELRFKAPNNQFAYNKMTTLIHQSYDTPSLNKKDDIIDAIVDDNKIATQTSDTSLLDKKEKKPINKYGFKEYIITIIVIGIILFVISHKLFGYVYGIGTIIYLISLFDKKSKFQSYSKGKKVGTILVYVMLASVFFNMGNIGSNNLDVASTNVSTPKAVEVTITPEQKAKNDADAKAKAAQEIKDDAAAKVVADAKAIQDKKIADAQAIVDAKVAAAKVISDKKAADVAAAQAASDRAAAAQALKAQYDTGITYNQLARTPDAYIGKKVKLSGKVVQVIEGASEIDLRVAVGDNYDTILLVAYDPSIVTSRILENDEITVKGVSQGITTYKSTMGGDISLPAVTADSFN